MKTSDSVKEITKALCAAQQDFPAAEFDSVNPHYHNKYASLSSIWRATKAGLSKHGLAMAQGVEAEGRTVRVTTTLFHESGEWISSTLSLTAGQDNPQAVGSAITYGRRYGMAAMVGIVAEEDDDAEQGSKPAPPEAKEYPRDSARQAGDAIREAVAKANAANRKADAMAWFEMTHGTGIKMRLAIQSVLNRKVPPPPEEIAITLKELDVLESHIAGHEHHKD